MSGQTPGAARSPRHRRRWSRLLAGASAVLVLAVSLAAWYLVRPRPFRAQVLIHVSHREPTVLGERPADDEENYRRFVKSQQVLVTSRLVLDAALLDPAIANLGLVLRQRDPVDWLEGHLEVRHLEGSELLEIALAAEPPGDAVRVVNTVAKVYRELVVSFDQDQQHHRHEKLLGLWKQYQQEIRSSRSELAQAAERLGAGGEKQPDLSDQQQAIEVKERLARAILEEAERLRIEFGAPARIQVLSNARLPELTSRPPADRSAR